jgi:hypothetical protein
MRLRKEIADRMIELAGSHNYNVPPVLRWGIENMIDDAFQIAGTSWKCDCGAITWTEEEMAQHFRQEHLRSAHELYGICGTGDEFVDRGFAAVFHRINQLEDLLKKHSIPVPQFQSEIVAEPLARWIPCRCEIPLTISGWLKCANNSPTRRRARTPRREPLTTSPAEASAL